MFNYRAWFKCQPSMLAIIYIIHLKKIQTSTIIEKNCELDCPAHTSEQQICASDGKIYADECRSKCHKSDNIKLFECDKSNLFMCKIDCKLAYDSRCDARCSTIVDSPQICATDGKLYPNICLAKCKNPNNTLIFTCALIDLFCAQRCITTALAKIRECEKNCPMYSKASLKCASDGNIYTDDCRALCFDPEIKILFECEPSNNKKNCLEKCSDALK